MADRKKVAVVMGSDSDLPVVGKAIDKLKAFGIPVEAHVMSAHRTPRGGRVLLLLGGGQRLRRHHRGGGQGRPLGRRPRGAHHPAGHRHPGEILHADGLDALLATVQMPSGIPVATVAINGGKNAGILAAKILAASDPELLSRLKAYSEKMKNEVVGKAEKLDKTGYKEYLASMKK